jgi:hypothetical protein
MLLKVNKLNHVTLKIQFNLQYLLLFCVLLLCAWISRHSLKSRFRHEATWNMHKLHTTMLHLALLALRLDLKKLGRSCNDERTGKGFTSPDATEWEEGAANMMSDQCHYESEVLHSDIIMSHCYPYRCHHMYVCIYIFRSWIAYKCL